VRLHVPAKRYLLATDADYYSKLSPASVVTLKLQGGPMAAHEVAQFETERFHKDAVRVRQWDDQGKVAGLKSRLGHCFSRGRGYTAELQVRGAQE
jgi:predicted HD phosphohydrolase